ncbi:MAG: 8-amino-7-oxononanoate synthase [Rikenellaceae bacterium]
MREEAILLELAQTGNLRLLGEYRCEGGFIFDRNQRRFVNLSSNDYLGLTSRLDLQESFWRGLSGDRFLMSNPSSRLMCGNSSDYSALEGVISSFYGAESALVSASGFSLNSSIVRALADRDCLFLADKLVHASLNDGLLLSGSRFERFSHNDMDHLERILSRNIGRRVVVLIESVYSMDGDLAPVDKILALKAQYGFELVVDEAHALGVMGLKGEGLFGVDAPVDYRIGTLGKACASVGGFVVCSEARRAVLINRMRSTIFSTALPSINLLWSKFIFERLSDFTSERAHLRRLIEMVGGRSQILPVMAGSNQWALDMRDHLLDEGFWATAIRHPTVKQGSERIRISLCASHSKEDIDRLCKLIG